MKDIKMRVSKAFEQDLKRLKAERVRVGVDDETVSYRRLTEGMRQTPSYPKLLDELRFIPNKKRRKYG